MKSRRYKFHHEYYDRILDPFTRCTMNYLWNVLGIHYFYRPLSRSRWTKGTRSQQKTGYNAMVENISYPSFDFPFSIYTLIGRNLLLLFLPRILCGRSRYTFVCMNAHYRYGIEFWDRYHLLIFYGCFICLIYRLPVSIRANP